jgi:hypothetical protein
MSLETLGACAKKDFPEVNETTKQRNNETTKQRNNENLVGTGKKKKHLQV